METSITANSLNWKQIAELWDTDIARVLEWIENAKICLEALQGGKYPDDSISEIKLTKSRLEAARRIVDEMAAFLSASQQLPEQQSQFERVQQELEKLKKKISSLDIRLEEVIETSIANSPKEAELFLSKTAEPIPTGAPFISSLESQLRRDLWYDRDGVAVFSKVAKSNPQNYIEHTISPALEM